MSATRRVLWWAVGGYLISGAAAFMGQHQLLRKLRAGLPVGRNVWAYREISVGVFFAATGAAMSFAERALS